jgi:uncharacterized membrane protein YkoI
MRYLLFALVPVVLLHAQELTPSQVSSMYMYDYSTSAQIKHKRMLAKMATLQPSEAHDIAMQHCQGDVQNIKLIRHAKRLFYAMQIEKCSIRIDALDGSIISKKAY